jgi:hypothetical protein
MPLQKPYPQGTPSADHHSSQRRQQQDRRRTLHTISELSVTDGAMPDFSSIVATKQKQQRTPINTTKRNVPNLNKRRSLPQYCSSPQCLQAQALVDGLSEHTSASHRLPSMQDTHAGGISRHDQGWNARRERARMQREQAVGREYRRQSLSNQPQDGSYPTLPRKAVPSTSRSSLRSYSSHHQLLANSRSISGFSSSSFSNGTLDRRSSLGTLGGHSDARGFDAESFGRASTDSSSHQSTHGSAVRRSRSGSSSDASFTSPVAPPIPVASPPPMKRYYSMPAPYLNNTTTRRHSTSIGHTKPSSNTRKSSLPTIRIDRTGATDQSNMHSMSRSPQHQHQSDVQRARLASLAALTATQPGQHSSPPQLTTSRRMSVSPKQSQPACPHSYSHLKPPPQYSALPPLSSHPTRTSTTKHNSTPTAYGDKLDIATREVPKRESLTQWKAEREAKAESGGSRRAHMKDMVRRANELELEREHELMKVGKGTGKEEKKRGCFGGFLALFGLGR